MYKGVICLISVFLIINNLVNAQSSDYKNLDFSAQWFLAYRNMEIGQEKLNSFQLKRGYITLQNKFTKHISARFTQDVSVDREGDGEGDVELRLKYGYLRFTFNNLGVFTEPLIEAGLVHRPWLSFEQRVNDYRVQGSMFLERADVLSSADYGVTVESLIGGKMDEEYQKNVSKRYPGKYGSFAFGIYNGGGYHAIEKNENKLFEGRLTIRPLPDLIPGLQFSYMGGFGKGNIAESPDLNYNVGFVSYESYHLVVTGLYYTGTGGESGKYVNTVGESYQNTGYSIFAELKLFEKSISLIARLDQLTLDKNNASIEYKNYIAGIAYHFMPNSKLLFDYDYIDHGTSQLNNSVFEIAIEFNY